MLQAQYKKQVLYFKRPGGTSRGVLRQKTSFYLIVWDDNNPTVKGIGECSTIKGLSIDPWDQYEKKLESVCNNITAFNYWIQNELDDFPSIRFGLETAILDWQQGGHKILFASKFSQGRLGIPINGLIWMGSSAFMKAQIQEKLNAGFRCIKLKIGSIDFEEELALLRMIRTAYPSDELELRVDANGAFLPEEALEKLKRLSEFQIHSIEQPIRQNQWEEMARLCQQTPIPIALDEELIGRKTDKEIISMLDNIKPQFVILKPSLIGGFSRSKRIISEAEKRNTGWWLTSALEGNIGLNALAQWVFLYENSMPQGLGTGQLFRNNIPSPLTIRNAELWIDENGKWDVENLVELEK